MFTSTAYVTCKLQPRLKVGAAQRGRRKTQHLFHVVEWCEGCIKYIYFYQIRFTYLFRTPLPPPNRQTSFRLPRYILGACNGAHWPSRNVCTRISVVQYVNLQQREFLSDTQRYSFNYLDWDRQAVQPNSEMIYRNV